MGKTLSLHVYCQRKFRDQVRAYANSQGLTVSGAMRQAIIEKMEQNGKSNTY